MMRCGHSDDRDNRVCNLCESDFEACLKKTTLAANLEALKMTRPEEFPSTLDKTICVMKGVSREKFEAMSNFTKDTMRDKLDHDKAIRGRNEASSRRLKMKPKFSGWKMRSKSSRSRRRR